MPALPLYGEVLAPGAVVGEWVVQRLAGEGASSHLYAAARPSGERAALKVLKRAWARDAVALKRMAEEAAALAAVAHPGVVRLLARGDTTDARPYLVLEWLEGDTLAQRLAAQGRLPVDQGLRVAVAVAAALEATHAAGLVHRDLKSAHVMLCADGRVVLLDYGIARAAAREVSLTSTGQVLGTPLALAPELIRGGGPSAASDVYALGVLLFELFTGEPPFQAETRFELEQQHLAAAPPLMALEHPAGVALEAAVRGCLAKGPGDRFPSAGEVGGALAALGAAPEALVLGVDLESSPGPDEGPAALDALDGWDADTKAQLRAWGFVSVVDGVQSVAWRPLLDAADGERWRARLEAWVAGRRAALPPSAALRTAVEVRPGTFHAGRLREPASG